MSSKSKGARGASPGRTQRQLRMGELVRKALSDILTQGLVNDERLESAVVTISEARISPDLKNVNVFTLPLGGKNQDAVIEALNEHKKFIRGQLSRQVTLKYTPQLKFELDTSFDNFSKIETVLRSPHVSRDLGPEDEAENASDPDTDIDHGTDYEGGGEPGSNADSGQSTG